MAGTKCIITGVPGVGKTTVITGALTKLEEMGVHYANISFGSFMFDTAMAEGLVRNRDEMRLLAKDDQRSLQRKAAAAIAKTDGNVIVDTHASVKTPKGYLPGLPEWVLEALQPDLFVLIETDEDQILGRRLGDPSRVRDMDSLPGTFVPPVIQPSHCGRVRDEDRLHGRDRDECRPPA